MSRNLTLTIDEDLLRSARKVALDRNTSVNQLVREFLADLVRQSGARQEAITEIEKLFAERPLRLGGITWTRDELHER